MVLIRFRYRLLIVLLGCCALSHSRLVHAQEFQPPRPPPLDPATDFEDMEEDMMEMGDEGYKPPAPPPNGNNVQPPPPPPMDTHQSANGAAFGTAASKNKIFKIVDGEFYEKGKKRTRGVKIRGQSSPGS